MPNKRNRNYLDPVRINNYNKFISTLDNTANNTANNNTNNTPDNSININNILRRESKLDEIKRTLATEESIKNEIDKIIENINKNFTLNDISSSNFTGQSQNDIQMSHIETNDPNKYIDFLNKGLNIKIYKLIPNPSSNPSLNTNPSPLPKKEEIPVPIIETINISVEINNIADILKLIDTYKNDPAIKYNIDMNALHNIKEPLEELNSMIGMKNLKNNIVDQILYFVQQLHKNKNSSGEFLHTVIYGPPGTGKTEVAKIMGTIYSKIGFLSKGTFKKVTRSDLVAGYLGQTALKTKDVIKEALGGVLFIDEAYSLGNPEKKDSFAKECIDTLCEALSDNKENLMVIIAGYEKELKESFFAFNQGLDSRFTWRFKTDEYTPEDLYQIFIKMVKCIGWEIEAETKINVEWFKKNKEYFQFFGRDIETLLAKTKIAHSRRVFCLPESNKKKISLRDLDKGFEIFLKNEDVKNRRDEREQKRYMYNTLYS
jgi:SpoVK/Ycf46/Vps4 family AAA+-type ATPase